MDVCRFINSKDVAEHLRAAGYQFNTFETVYFVEQFADATLDEKISAWKEIAETMPNCPTTWSPNYEKRGSTHSFLREYAALQQHMLDEFENKKGFVYAVQSTGSIAHRVEELLRGDEVLGADDVSTIKAALEAAHHPIEIEPEIDFEYVSATLHEALSLIARSVAEEKEDEDFARVSVPESETCSVVQARRPSPALVSGAVALLLGLAGGYVLGSTGKWR